MYASTGEETEVQRDNVSNEMMDVKAVHQLLCTLPMAMTAFDLTKLSGPHFSWQCYILNVDQEEETIKSPSDFSDRTLALGDVGMDENPPHIGVHGFQHKIFSGTG